MSLLELKQSENKYQLFANGDLLANFLPITAGSYRREDGADVKVNAFYMAEFPVTQHFYKEVTDENPSRFEGINHPVEQVSWYDAIEFCIRLNETLGLLPGFYTLNKNSKDKNNKSEYDDLKWTVNLNPTGRGFRLPTEAEWEYAARGGENHGFAGSNTLQHVGWYNANSHQETKPVGLKFPNAFGLHDMSGNVWEWCWDWYAEYDKKVLNNPLGAKSGTHRSDRGGSWHGLAIRCRTDYRSGWGPDNRRGSMGFRLLLVP